MIHVLPCAPLGLDGSFGHGVAVIVGESRGVVYGHEKDIDVVEYLLPEVSGRDAHLLEPDVFSLLGGPDPRHQTIIIHIFSLRKFFGLG